MTGLAWLLATLVLLTLAAWEAWKIRLGLASMAWAVTTGTLNGVWVEDDLQVPGDPFADQEGTHTVHARYRYRVGGRWYDGRRLSYRTTMWIRFSEALRMIDGMRVGREIEVFYDPRKPARAVLIPGSSPANAVLLGVYLVLAALLQLPRLTP